MIFRVKSSTCVEKTRKKKNFWGYFQITFEFFLTFCFRHQKSGNHLISIYRKCMISIFFDNMFFHFFYLVPKT